LALATATTTVVPCIDQNSKVVPGSTVASNQVYATTMVYTITNAAKSLRGC
jgi:hypothetical protein